MTLVEATVVVVVVNLVVVAVVYIVVVVVAVFVVVVVVVVNVVVVVFVVLVVVVVVVGVLVVVDVTPSLVPVENCFVVTLGPRSVCSHFITVHPLVVMSVPTGNIIPFTWQHSARLSSTIMGLYSLLTLTLHTCL